MEISLKKTKQSKINQSKQKPKQNCQKRGKDKNRKKGNRLTSCFSSPHPYIYTQAKIWFLLFMRVFPTVKKDNFFFFFLIHNGLLGLSSKKENQK